MSTEVQDLRTLLEAVCEALDVTGGDVDRRRIDDRALWALITVRAALREAPEDLAWNVGYLRRKLAEEAERHAS
ncbi:hypothetical protein [Streptomyces sp. NBC_00459]|uniref:hypothetical protein n=1 Tax=Streptomyces sp. NBC_00459 TaxID=2975749 RepID=UPI002E1753DB